MRKEDSEYWKSKMPDSGDIVKENYDSSAPEYSHIQTMMKEYTTKVLEVLRDRMDTLPGEMNYIIIQNTIDNLK